MEYPCDGIYQHIADELEKIAAALRGIEQECEKMCRERGVEIPEDEWQEVRR